jgi:hypothetical protein
MSVMRTSTGKLSHFSSFTSSSSLPHPISLPHNYKPRPRPKSQHPNKHAYPPSHLLNPRPKIHLNQPCENAPVSHSPRPPQTTKRLTCWKRTSLSRSNAFMISIITIVVICMGTDISMCKFTTRIVTFNNAAKFLRKQTKSLFSGKT